MDNLRGNIKISIFEQKRWLKTIKNRSKMILTNWQAIRHVDEKNVRMWTGCLCYKISSVYENHNCLLLFGQLKMSGLFVKIINMEIVIISLTNVGCFINLEFFLRQRILKIRFICSRCVFFLDPDNRLIGNWSRRSMRLHNKENFKKSTSTENKTRPTKITIFSKKNVFKNGRCIHPSWRWEVLVRDPVHKSKVSRFFVSV